MSRKRLGEPFPMPLFCPECFEPLGEGNRLYPTEANPTGVGCEACWINPLCPAGCNGIHGAPVPRGARRQLRRYSIPGTWTCPTTGEHLHYLGANCEGGWADLDNWYDDPHQRGSYLGADNYWWQDENEYHDENGHEWCSSCGRYIEGDIDDHYDQYHYEAEYEEYDEEYEWQSNAAYWNPITEEVSSEQHPGYVIIPVYVRSAA